MIIITGIGYLGVRYQQYLFFWRYSYNKINDQLEKASKTVEAERTARLLEISAISEDYASRNLSAESFFLHGRIHFYLGESYLRKTFSQYIISNNDGINREAEAEFINAIKCIKKGMALGGEGNIDQESLVILAKSYFYCKYYDINYVFKTIEKMSEVEELRNTEDIRFIAVLNILNKREDYGLELLSGYGMVSDSIDGRFFLASAYSLAGKYTDAITGFKYILEKSQDTNLLKTANMNLGRIYYNQSLFRESLSHFMEAFKVDANDNLLKIWIGKDYSALGDKVKAKAMWNDVLISDQGNREARKLLGIM